MKKELSPLEKKLNDWVSRYLSRISFVQKIFFVDHLRTMIKAGLSLIESLNILSKEVGNKKFKIIIGEIKDKVEKGRQLSEVLAEYPKIFPTIYVRMIASGEISGKLEESLSQVTVQMQKTHQLTSSIRGAMIYPSVIVTAMGGIGVMMAVLVLPKMVELFKDFDAELPLATRILIAITDFMSKPLNMVLVVIAIISFVAVFLYLLRSSKSFRKFVHAFNLRMPIFGQVIKKINLARFSLTLSSLLKSTIPIIDAVEITGETCSNVLYREALSETSKTLKNGKPLSEKLSEYDRLFPPMVTEMIMVGERTGEVEQLLSELAEFYNQEVDKTMKNFTTIIEPVIIIAIGLAVAGMAVAVLMPMYTLVQNF